MKDAVNPEPLDTGSEDAFTQSPTSPEFRVGLSEIFFPLIRKPASCFPNAIWLQNCLPLFCFLPFLP